MMVEEDLLLEEDEPEEGERCSSFVVGPPDPVRVPPSPSDDAEQQRSHGEGEASAEGPGLAGGIQASGTGACIPALLVPQKSPCAAAEEHGQRTKSPRGGDGLEELSTDLDPGGSQPGRSRRPTTAPNVAAGEKTPRDRRSAPTATQSPPYGPFRTGGMIARFSLLGHRVVGNATSQPAVATVLCCGSRTHVHRCVCTACRCDTDAGPSSEARLKPGWDPKKSWAAQKRRRAVSDAAANRMTYVSFPRPMTPALSSSASASRVEQERRVRTESMEYLECPLPPAPESYDECGGNASLAKLPPLPDSTDAMTTMVASSKSAVVHGYGGDQSKKCAIQ